MVKLILSIALLVQAIIASELGDETSSLLNNVPANGNVNVNNTVNVTAQTIFIDDKGKCATQSQLEVMKDVVVRLAAIEINNKEFRSTNNILDKLYVYDEPPIEAIFNYIFNNCFEDSFSRLLQFVNFTTNVNSKMIGYKTLFTKIASDSNLSKLTSNWVHLQHMVSHDVSAAPQLQTLLNEIESKFNIVLDSPDFHYVDRDVIVNSKMNANDCNPRTYHPPGGHQPYYHEIKHNLQYLVQRFCSTDPPKIITAHKTMLGAYHQVENSTIKIIESIRTCITELERSNRLNYTLLMLPWMHRELVKSTANTKLGQMGTELIQKFPTNSSIRNLLSKNYEFYIRNAYTNEYLNHHDTSIYVRHRTYRRDVRAARN